MDRDNPESALKRPRIIFVDYLKALLIVTVVVCHIYVPVLKINPWFRSFNIPAFFFASGFMLKKTGSGRVLLGIIGKGFRSLMIPYYLWAVIYTALNVHNVAYILYASYVSLDKGKSLTLLWFLPVLFSGIVLFLLIQFLFRERLSLFVKLAIVLICFIGANFLPSVELGYPMGINVAIVALGFIILGNTCFPILLKYQAYAASRKRIIGLTLTGAIMEISCVVSYVCASLNFPYVEALLVADARYGNYWLFLLGSFIGIVFACFMALFLDLLHLKRLGRLFSYLGRNSFAIYVLHKPIVVIMRSVFKRINVPNWIELIATCAIAVAVSCLGSVILNRYAPVLLGQALDCKQQ